MANAPASSQEEADKLVRVCNEYLTSRRAKLAQGMEDGQRGIDVAQGYARMFDGLFKELLEAATARVHSRTDASGRIAVVAVGGYGRGLVAPHSDVDIIVLCDQPQNPWAVAVGEAMLYPLWDCGVDVGHALRGIDDTLELSRVDIRTATTLLDLRLVAGDKSIMDELARRGRSEIFGTESQAFIAALTDDTKRRHERYGGTLYMREPEIKWGRGGLRDLDVVAWIGRARWAADDFDQLVAAGGLTENEWLDLRAARDHLWSVRNHLHAMARRRQDRLTFEDQEVVASRLGYRDGVTRGVEQFMQVHYRHARVVARAVDGMMERACRTAPPGVTMRDLGQGLFVQDGHIFMDDRRLQQDPSIALRLFRAVQRERLPPAPQVRDAISAVSHDRDWCQMLRRELGSGALFLDLISQAERAQVRRGSVLDELHDLGLLLAMVPEFEPVMGRAPHDSYYAYTADAQAIKSVDYLRSVLRGERSTEFHDVTRAAAELPRPIPLTLALLLHSIGATHPDDPAGYAAAVAGHVARRLGLEGSAVRHVQWLIGMQNAFYAWATRRDVNDPDTISEVASEVETVYRLRDLYLFTFANVATANPKAMTAWNARMLEDLWHAVQRYLEGKEDDIGARLTAEALQGVDDPEERECIQTFVREMPLRYLQSNTAEGIRFHCRAGERKPGCSVVVAATPSGVGDATLEVVVVADDRPGILATFAAALAGCRFELDSAQLYTRERTDGRREAFDLFHVNAIRRGSGTDVEEHLQHLQERIAGLLDGSLTTAEVLSNRRSIPPWERTGPRIKTDIHIDNAASTTYTVIDVYTRSREGLLQAIAEELHAFGLTIALAKVNTEGDRVADVFYVTTEAGAKLEQGARFNELSTRLRRAIQALEHS